MDEKQALLRKKFDYELKFNRRDQKVSEDDEDVSSEGSDDWWEEQSECSSCCESHSESSVEWEKDIKENGELFYIQSNSPECTISSQTCYTNQSGSGTLDDKKFENTKKGRLLNWMRRKNSKNLSVRKNADNSSSVDSELSSQKNILKTNSNIDSIGEGDTLCEKLLGLSLILKNNELVVINIVPNGPAHNCCSISIGCQSNNELFYFKQRDVIHKINNFIVTPDNIENILHSLNFPCQVEIRIEKVDNPLGNNKSNYQSPFVEFLTKRNDAVDNILLNQPLGIVVVDVESQNLNKDDVIYCYPEKCVLSSCRGAFVTLYHLLAEIKPNDICRSSNVKIKEQPTYIFYNAEDNFLILIAIPQWKCTLKEATYVVQDLIKNLLFNNQTLKRCFEINEKSCLDHFFSLFFTRLLINGFLSDGTQQCNLENLTNNTYLNNTPLYGFEDILPYAGWVPLPKEAQIQINEALNELEANDFENMEKNQRLFSILGSCFFHKGYLLASHLSKDDLLDVYSFYRQNGLIQLFRNEPVKSLVIWKQVFPLSVNRGFSSNKPGNYPVPKGKWFIIVVGQGFDSLAVILEAGEFCAKICDNAGPALPYIEEAEETLIHMQKLGISSLASQWLENNSRFRTVTPEEVFINKMNNKKDNLLNFVKTFDGTQKNSAQKSLPQKSEESILGKKNRGTLVVDTSEDSISQTPSNEVSEISDENAPILGRRGERNKISNENITSESDSSDSDWDSSKDSNMRESVCSGSNENFYLYNVGEVLPSRLTTGPEDILFYYVHLDGNDGILMNPPMNLKRNTPKMKELLQNFRRCCHIIHSILENNIKFKKNAQDSTKQFINKSLVAVKEHGVIFECTSSETDCNKKPMTFTYWIIGRLFFTPQPREIYVCYHDDAPQNLVEIAFRLGLSAAG
ncbi:PDZ domain-containing protein, putative [Pediculus humanus corporis]|uniref:PDZ domain-containing protein, putative n=1 Tax=Pediculus humanus subsp. corporis TaxID=121224 RepID=E0VGY9_PEDHC|nr:PDZ domain-containing protein, putative [Pediculus humanus corporis]EEB12645.1 PDZ domain-containing protein, putative [Pediculus humanus corporis]